MNHPLLARSGLSLDRLASLVAMADAGGLSAAAKGDAVRQSQLSRQLKELEAFFGTALVLRRRGVFQLTPAGQNLLDIARGALTGLDDFERHCTGQLTEVHIGAGESVLVWLLTPRLGSLLEAEPKVTFSLHNLQSEEVTRRLRDGRLDFGILRRQDVAAGLEGAALGIVSHALFVPHTALLPGRRESARQLLSRLPLAVLEGNGAIHEILAAWAAEHRVTLQIRLRCTSLVQVAAAVSRAGLAAVLPLWAARDLPSEVRQVPLPCLRALEAPLQLVWTRRQFGVRPFLARLAREIPRMIDARPVQSRPDSRSS